MAKIGFTMGVYDLLHKGHVRFFERAKAICDYLIVGVVSDEAVRNKKGPNRPMMSQKERMYLVKALKPVDEVMPLQSFNPIIELEKKFTNVLEEKEGSYYKNTLAMFIKGEDQEHIHHGYALIHDIPLVYIQRTPDISTSETIRRMNNVSN